MEGNNAFHDGFSFDSTRCRTITCEGWDRLYLGDGRCITQVVWSKWDPPVLQFSGQERSTDSNSRAILAWTSPVDGKVKVAFKIGCTEIFLAYFLANPIAPFFLAWYNPYVSSQ